MKNVNFGIFNNVTKTKFMNYYKDKLIFSTLELIFMDRYIHSSFI